MIKVLKYLGIRIGILLLILTIVISTMYALYDPHTHCDGENHRHTMGIGMGIAVMSVSISGFWLFILLLEALVHFAKKGNNIGIHVLLFIMILLVILFTFI